MILKKYDFFMLVKITLLTFLSKVLINKNIRSVKGYPLFYNRKRISLGSNLTLGYYNRIEACGLHGTVIIGDNVKMNDMVHIGSEEKIVIGDNVLIGSRVTIVDQDHGDYVGPDYCSPNTFPDDRKIVTRPVTIGDNCWIGEGAVILKGVDVPPGCIIAANSVVTSSPSRVSIIAGVPAKEIKYYDEGSQRWVKK